MPLALSFEDRAGLQATGSVKICLAMFDILE